MSTITAAAGGTFDAELDGATNLAGPLTVAIYDTPETTALYGPSSTGITETPPASGLWAVTLTAPDDAGTYSVVWTDGVLFARDVLEVSGVVSEHYFTIDEARAFDPALADDVKYPDAAIEAVRANVEEELEVRCGQAFVPRAETETIDAPGLSDVLLRWPRPLSVISATLDGSTVTLGDLILYRDGRVYNAAGWRRGRGNLTISYTHGHALIPGAAKRAALTWAKTLLIKGPLDSRTTTYTTEDGNYTLATPGVRGSHTGIPVVDEFIDTYNLNCAVA